MTDNAAFLEFFNGAFQRELESTQIPGMQDASWDRKAAYLLWKSRLLSCELLAPAILLPPPEPAKQKLPWEK